MDKHTGANPNMSRIKERSGALRYQQMAAGDIQLGIAEYRRDFDTPPIWCPVCCCSESNEPRCFFLRIGKGFSGLFRVTPSTEVGIGYSKPRSDIADIEKVLANLIHFEVEAGQSAGGE